MAAIELDNGPSEDMIRLYSAWAQGGAGLIISGHVMVDRDAMASESATCLCRKNGAESLDAYRRWIAAGRQNQTRFWLQLNHPGRQMPNYLGQVAKAPSAVAMNLGRVGNSLFSEPVELTEAEILTLINDFVYSAKLAESLGVDGVQIHAAHGYLRKYPHTHEDIRAE